MRNIIWRNRASAILGLMVMLLPFTGFPTWMETVLFVLLGGLITLFGFTGTRRIDTYDVRPVKKEPVPVDDPFTIQR